MAGNLIVVPSEVFARTAADYIAQSIIRAGQQNNSIAVALSGGRGPLPVYQELARVKDLPWNRLEIFFADERAVAASDPLSNYRLVRETLGVRFSQRPDALHRMEADRGDLDAAAAEYDAMLPAALDLLVLGVGEDGHTASLFPGHSALGEERRRVLAVEGPAIPPWRMTITPPVLRAARSTLVLVAGAAKAAAVARALDGDYDPVSCPAQLARGGVWVLDQPAAARLQS